MATGLQVAGLASNFDWKSFVDSIMDLERAPATRLEAEKTTNSQKVSLLTTLGTRLTSLQDSAQALKAGSLFGKRSATSSTANSTWGATAASDTAAGSYKISVSQLATTSSLKGGSDVARGLNPSGDDVSGLTLANLPLAQAVTAGTFTVNGAKVTVAVTDSLEDVFNAISLATDGDVTASYDHTTDTVSLANSTGDVVLGASNDTSNFLRALKLGNNGSDTVTSSARLGTVKTSAALANANLSTPITAVDGNGAGAFKINGVEIAYDVDTDTLSSILTRINESSAGVSATYDSLNDRLVLANKSTGDLGISVSESPGGLLGALGLTSGTTFARGLNAEFSLDGGATLSSASNTLDQSAHGIAGLSVTVKNEETQTITVAADTTAMRAKIDAFITDFNGVQSFLDTYTKVSTDSKGKVTPAPLSSNREIQDWGRSLRTMAFASVSGLTGGIGRLNDLGIDFKAGSNELEVESDSKLTAALATSTTDVANFFTSATTGFAAKLDTYLGTVGSLNTEQKDRITKSNNSIDEQIAAIERRLKQQREVMESAFISMEMAQSKIKQQQSALDGMISSFSS
ncbi:MAG: flagellar filament capping protein FliD [Verrucomicrobiota bacterium]